MDFSVLMDNFEILVVLACLIVGYVIKTAFDIIPNKYIPTILAVVGAIVNVIIGGISVETVVYGALSGLASTGLHQAFKQFVEGNKNTTSE